MILYAHSSYSSKEFKICMMTEFYTIYLLLHHYFLELQIIQNNYIIFIIQESMLYIFKKFHTLKYKTYTNSVNIELKVKLVISHISMNSRFMHFNFFIILALQNRLVALLFEEKIYNIFYK